MATREHGHIVETRLKHARPNGARPCLPPDGLNRLAVLILVSSGSCSFVPESGAASIRRTAANSSLPVDGSDRLQ